MAASTFPFSCSGQLLYPPDDGAQQQSVPFGVSGSFISLADTRYNLVGAGTQVVGLGTVAKAKFLLVEYDPSAEGAVVNLRINGGSDNLELAPGGFLVYSNPNPSVGLSALSIVYTSDAAIRVRVFG